ncbi:MAG TPA: hypothetical protein VFZ66_12585 [Herpetosiphonaceae bacterium]
MYRSLWKYGSALLILTALAACGQPAEQTAGTAPEGSQAPVTIGGDNTSTGPSIGGPAITSHGGAVKDHVSLVDNLRAKGFMVEPVSEVEQPFLGVKGTTLRISGGELKQAAEVQSYEYTSADAATTDVEQLGPDANPQGMMIEWKGTPHVFQKEQLVVIYVGDDQAMVQTLTDLVGPQVAGK